MWIKFNLRFRMLIDTSASIHREGTQPPARSAPSGNGESVSQLNAVARELWRTPSSLLHKSSRHAASRDLNEPQHDDCRLNGINVVSRCTSTGAPFPSMGPSVDHDPFAAPSSASTQCEPNDEAIAVELPDHLPLLTVGLARALGRMIANDAAAAESPEIRDFDTPRAIASPTT